jgi:hypothetical protein
MSERCPRCDRKPGTEWRLLGSPEYCLHFADCLQLPNTNWGDHSASADCVKHAVDWRQRALDAERERDRALTAARELREALEKARNVAWNGPPEPVWSKCRETLNVWRARMEIETRSTLNDTAWLTDGGDGNGNA